MEEKLLERTIETINLRKRLGRLEMREKKLGLVNMEGREVQKISRKRSHQRILPNNQRRLMCRIISHFFHQDEVSTVINGKSGENRNISQESLDRQHGDLP